MEWFGLPKSLTFNRLRVPTETAIKLNDTYLFGCKFDPFYYLPLRCILVGCLGSLCYIGPTLVMAVGSPLVVLPTIVAVGYSHQCIDPCCYTLGRGPSSLPITTIGCSQIQPHRPQPLCTDLSRFQRTIKPRCADLMMQIWGGGIRQSKPFCGIFLKNLRKSN